MIFSADQDDRRPKYLNVLQLQLDSTYQDILADINDILLSADRDDR